MTSVVVAEGVLPLLLQGHCDVQRGATHTALRMCENAQVGIKQFWQTLC